MAKEIKQVMEKNRKNRERSALRLHKDNMSTIRECIEKAPQKKSRNKHQQHTKSITKSKLLIYTFLEQIQQRIREIRRPEPCLVCRLQLICCSQAAVIISKFLGKRQIISLYIRVLSEVALQVTFSSVSFRSFLFSM